MKDIYDTAHSAKKLYDLELIVGSEYGLCPPWPRKVQKQESWLPLTKYSLSSDGQFHQLHHGTHLTYGSAHHIWPASRRNRQAASGLSGPI